jgi:hypothetical protein
METQAVAAVPKFVAVFAAQQLYCVYCIYMFVCTLCSSTLSNQGLFHQQLYSKLFVFAMQILFLIKIPANIVWTTLETINMGQI